jgi:hypothetical protein
MSKIFKVMAVFLPLFLIDLIAIPFYWHSEVQVSSATVVSNVLFVCSLATYIFGVPLSYLLNYRMLSSQIIWSMMVILGFCCLLTSFVAFSNRLYHSVTFLYFYVLMIVHLTLLPLIYWLLTPFGIVLKCLFKTMRRFYLQEEIRQRKLNIDSHMIKRFEVENQLKDEINCLIRRQSEMEYQTLNRV